jgi:hypothetical protein
MLLILCQSVLQVGYLLFGGVPGDDFRLEGRAGVGVIGSLPVHSRLKCLDRLARGNQLVLQLPVGMGMLLFLADERLFRLGDTLVGFLSQPSG